MKAVCCSCVTALHQCQEGTYLLWRHSASVFPEILLINLSFFKPECPNWKFKENIVIIDFTRELSFFVIWSRGLLWSLCWHRVENALFWQRTVFNSILTELCACKRCLTISATVWMPVTWGKEQVQCSISEPVLQGSCRATATVLSLLSAPLFCSEAVPVGTSWTHSSCPVDTTLQKLQEI